MRLTLRTMLAYLDNILEPQDAETLGAKISDSEFASELVYRTLSSIRKANLNAPPLDGKGIGPDPNSVAEKFGPHRTFLALAMYKIANSTPK